MLNWFQDKLSSHKSWLWVRVIFLGIGILAITFTLGTCIVFAFVGGDPAHYLTIQNHTDNAISVTVQYIGPNSKFYKLDEIHSGDTRYFGIRRTNFQTIVITAKDKKGNLIYNYEAKKGELEFGSTDITINNIPPNTAGN
jgi:hypothetical protein